MRCAYWLIALFGIGAILCVSVDRIAPNDLSVLVFVVLFSALVIAIGPFFGVGVGVWRKTSRYWMGPALLSCVMLLGILQCGNLGILEALEDWRLRHNMASYSRIVDAVRDGKLPCHPVRSEAAASSWESPLDLPPHTRTVWSDCCPDGSILVVFSDTRGSAVGGHSGYLYKDYSATSSCASDFAIRERRYILRPIAKNWYRWVDAQ